jgi:chromosome segregation ATPase
MTTRRGNVMRVLKENIGELETDALVQCVDISIAENNKHMYNLHIRPLTKKIDALTRSQETLTQNQTDLKKEMSTLRVEMKEGFAKEREERKEGLSKLELNMTKIKGELEVKISDFKSDILRWMFAFFVTMLLALIGLYFKK